MLDAARRGTDVARDCAGADVFRKQEFAELLPSLRELLVRVKVSPRSRASLSDLRQSVIHGLAALGVTADLPELPPAIDPSSPPGR